MSDGCLNCQELERQLRAARLSQPATHRDQRRMQRLDTLGQLAAAITHEYNNSISVILHSSDMLIEELPDDDTRAHAERIQRAATRARLFTRQLSTFGRVRSLRDAPLDCDALLGDWQAAIAEQCASCGIAVEMILEASPARVLADRGQFEILVHSLIANARDAMSGGGVLRISTGCVELDESSVAPHIGATAGRHLLLMVVDSGPGVATDTFDQIFEPFFTTKPRAMGLGLAAVYAIAKSAGGFVRVENRVDGGACFSVALPVMPAQPAA